jgi:hypothetical protein
VHQGHWLSRRLISCTQSVRSTLALDCLSPTTCAHTRVKRCHVNVRILLSVSVCTSKLIAARRTVFLLNKDPSMVPARSFANAKSAYIKPTTYTARGSASYAVDVHGLEYVWHDRYKLLVTNSLDLHRSTRRACGILQSSRYEFAPSTILLHIHTHRLTYMHTHAYAYIQTLR